VAAKIFGLHHITAISVDAQRNLEFYVKVLGLRLVKRTVNYDDPERYHLVLGDQTGRAGSLITLFPRPSAPRGRHGGGQATITGLSVPTGALSFWRPRLRRAGARHLVDENVHGADRAVFQDPDGLLLALVECEDPRDIVAADGIPETAAIRGLHGVTIAQQSPALLSEILQGVFGFREQTIERIGSARHCRFVLDQPNAGGVIDVQIDANILRGTEGSGTIHHIALGVETEDEQAEFRERLMQAGLHATEAIDRYYFRSVYARTPGGILFEVATRGPGFAIDEPLESLGEMLCLPEHLEPRRAQLLKQLPKLEI